MKGWVGLRNNSILMLKVNGQGQESQKNSAGVGLGTLVSAAFI